MPIAYVIYRVSDLKIIAYYTAERESFARSLARKLTKESGEHEYKVGDEAWVKANWHKIKK